MSEYCIIITTCASSEDARDIATALLAQQLAACVQIVDSTSHYQWKGEQRTEPEKLLFIKTRRALYADVATALLRIHKYETPEVICVPIVAGLPAYLGWIDEVTRGNR